VTGVTRPSSWSGGLLGYPVDVTDYQAEYRQSARDLTARLRTGEGTGWAGLRETLLSQGIDPAQAAVAVIFPDDVTILVAVVVTADRMLRVDIDYLGIDRSEAMDHGHVESWEDDVVVIGADPFVDLALELLASESSGS
jgi:hypothetical protein